MCQFGEQAEGRGQAGAGCRHSIKLQQFLSASEPEQIHDIRVDTFARRRERLREIIHDCIEGRRRRCIASISRP